MDNFNNSLIQIELTNTILRVIGRICNITLNICLFTGENTKPQT